MNKKEQAIQLLAEYLIENKEVQCHYEDDVCDMGDDGDGYSIYKTESLVFDSLPEIFSEEYIDFQEELENKINELIN